MVGHNAAIAEVGERRRELHGPLAFVAWLGVHAFLLEGFRSRAEALRSWTWDYFTKSRASALIDRPDAARIDWAGHDPTPFPTFAPVRNDRSDRDVRLTASHARAHRGLRHHRRHEDGRARRRRAARSTGGACLASTPARASRRCSASPSTAAGCCAPRARSLRPAAATCPTRSCSRPTYETPTGTAVVIDFMSPGEDHSTIFRIVEGRAGTVEMEMELIVRFDYGSVPAVGAGDRRRAHDGRRERRAALPQPGAPPGARGPRDRGRRSRSATATRGASRSRGTPRSTLRRRRSTRRRRASRTLRYWREWVERCTYDGEWRDEVVRSLITVKALSYSPTGAVVAAATTSLPEQIGGVRNWDYRYSWLRDASLTLQSLLLSGYVEEAAAWQQWLQRARRRASGRLPDHVRRRRRAAAHGDGARLAARVRGLDARPHRQRGERAVPARRVRRGARRGLDRGAVRPGAGARPPRAPSAAGRVAARGDGAPREGVAASPTRASGRSAARAGTSRTRR